jgi:tRNA dimethylallyltransferase
MKKHGFVNKFVVSCFLATLSGMLHPIFIEKITHFLSDQNPLPKIIVVYGPTACGKTTMSLAIAEHFQGEIINVDSRQIYRGLTIGTGKILPAEMRGIPHHLLDICDIRDEYSVGEYKKTALTTIDQIRSRGHLPILCGGTGLYIDAVIENFEIPPVPADWEFRDTLEHLRLKKGNQYLWELLAEKDPDSAATIHPNNHHAVIRGLEVLEKTGQSKRALATKKERRFDVLFFTPYDGDRAQLYEKIDRRIEAMFRDGLVEEVKNLLAHGAKKTDPGMNTIGYKEVIEHLEGAMTLEECQALIARHNRNYAKRQCTWFRRYEGFPK